jgi:hypothetical protein
MMPIAERSELAIPKWSSEFIFGIVLSLIFVLGTILAILNLFFRWEEIGIIAACIWLAITALIIWSIQKNEGSFGKFRIDFLGFYARKQFVESIPQDTGVVEIRFGFQLFGHRLYNFSVSLDKIESVRWVPYYSSNCMFIALNFDIDDPEVSQRRQKIGYRKPDQDVYVVGPSRSKKKTEAFGRAFVDFLRRAGATLVQGEDDHTFVRITSKTQTHEEQSV